MKFGRLGGGYDIWKNPKDGLETGKGTGGGRSGGRLGGKAHILSCPYCHAWIWI